MSKVFSIVTRLIPTHLIQKGGAKHCTVRTGAVAFIQRLGSELNLNVHFYMLFLDGIYMDGFNKEKQVFKRVKAPTATELNALSHKFSQRVAQFLTKQGLLIEDSDNRYLNLDGLAPDPMQDLYGHSITYRVAVGARRGKKVFTSQTFLHKLVKAATVKWPVWLALIYMPLYTRPALSEERLAIIDNGNVRYQLKTPYRDGTNGDQRNHVIFTPLDFMAKLAALVPKPRVNLTSLFGVFAPNSQYRMAISQKKSKIHRNVRQRGHNS